MAEKITAAVAAQVAGLRIADVPADVVELARQCTLDWFGVTLAGSREPAAQIVAADLAEEYPISTGVTLVGRAERLPPWAAALANGTASHALDYDDVNSAMMGHPTVAILGALLALAESRGSSGADVVEAFVAGYEAQCRVAQAVGHQPYQRGLHATGTVGTFGAAAACARLLGLDAEQTATALGIAATQAAGLKAMFGTMSKPLHAGKACANGLLAARLAARGFTAHPGAIEAEQGFAETSGGEVDPAWADREPSGGWFLRRNLFKYHAACFATHSTIEGLRRMRVRDGFGPADVDAVVVHANAAQLRMCAIPEPETGLETKFSLRHLAAMTLSDVDTSSADSFTDACAHDPELVRLRQRVRVEADGPDRAGTPVDVALLDGRQLSIAFDVNTPASDLDEQRAALRAKFDALGSPVLGPKRSGELAALITALDELPDIAELMRASRLESP
jgi:2-methylcitrate dehydratase PrpD